MAPTTHSGFPSPLASHPLERPRQAVAWTPPMSIDSFSIGAISMIRRLSLFVLLTLLLSFANFNSVYAQANPGCLAGACVSSGTRLADLNSQNSELLDGLLGSLLGSDLEVTLADWKALAAADVNLNELQMALGVATPEELLAEPFTLAQLLTALSNIDGLTELQAIDTLLSEVAAIPNADTVIILGDLLQIENGVGSFTKVNLNALDLVIGSIELFNSKNLVTTPTPITVDGADLGLDGVGPVTIQAQVLEPPVFVCGPTGTTFYSAGVRVKLGVELLNLDSQDSLFLGTGSVGIDLKLADIDVYLDVASGSGVLQTINAITRAVTVRATPGLTNIYVGTIADNLFFTSDPVNPANLTPGIVGSLTITVPGVPLLFFPDTVLTIPAIGIETYAEGTTAPKTLHFTGNPADSGNYPQTLTASASASVVTSYTTQLLTNLEIDANLSGIIDGLLGDILDGQLPLIVNGLLNLLGLDDILDLTDPILNSVTGTLLPNLLEPALDLVLEDIVDPVLDGLGIGLGEMKVTVLGITQACPALDVEKSHTGNFAAGSTGQYTIQVRNTGSYTRSICGDRGRYLAHWLEL